MDTLLGKWKLVKDGSDYMPGIDSLNDGPLALKMLGNSEVEFYKIEKKRILDAEFIKFTYVTRNVSLTKSYQVGILNFDQTTTNEVNLSIVQNCDDDFKELCIVRLGPNPGQNSRETYEYDSSTKQIRLSIECTTSEGTRLNLRKYLTRFSDNEPIQNISFVHSTNTMGWKLFDFWPSSVLTNAHVKIIRAMKIKSQDANTNEKVKIIETVWGDDDTTKESSFDFTNLPRNHGGKNSDGEEVVEFIINVRMGDSTWFVTHRYREFDSLRKFLLAQNPHVSEFQEADSRFPGKAVGLAFRKFAFNKRVDGLETFLNFYLDSARYCRQNSIDALCSFLELPEHMHAFAKKNIVDDPTPSPQKEPVKQQHVIPPQPVKVETRDKSKVVEKFVSKPQSKSTPPPSSSTPIQPAPSQPQPINISHASTHSAIPAPQNPKTNIPAAQPQKLEIPRQPLAVDANSKSKSSAEQRLIAVLGDKGIAVLKHGRQGAPKKRILTCDEDTTFLIIQAKDHYKKIWLSNVMQIRLGTEVDPATPPEALEKYKQFVDSQNTSGKVTGESKPRRQSMVRMVLGEDKNSVLFGTSTLRRTCKPEDMALCLSLILPDRSVDLQCENQHDLDVLYSCLKDICFKKA